VNADHDEPVVVTGAGGFIGGWLVADLLAAGHRRVRAVDRKPFEQWHQRQPDAENRRLDLRHAETCSEAVAGTAAVYHLAADMGGMGFIAANKASCMLSVLIDAHLLEAARDAGCRRLFYASSACVYPTHFQDTSDARPLREDDVHPASPEDGYGWQKLFGERLCRHFREDFGLETRVARYHNVYGEHGTWHGGREKAPAAICRKVAEAVRSGRHEIEIWGDGSQTRSFTHVTDCIEATRAILASDVAEPLNVGSDRLVSIDELVSLVEAVAGVTLERRYRPDAPTGVQGRNSDNDRIKSALGWAPSLPLEVGLERTYRWIERQLEASAR
jgi:GDP-D-mannose 3',5'-epimerase